MRSGKEASEENTVVLSRAVTQHGRKSAVENRCGFGSPRLKAVSSDSVENFDETKATELMNEKSRLEQRLAQYADAQQKRENAKSRLDEIYTILDGLKNHPLTYDDQIIRQILACVIVESKEKIKAVFVGGLEVEQEL